MSLYHAAIFLGAAAALIAIWLGPQLRDHWITQRAYKRAMQERAEMRRRADEEMEAARERVERQRERDERWAA